MKKQIDDSVKIFIINAADGVQLEGVCPICGTGRSQNGECWFGHIVIDVSKSDTISTIRQNFVEQRKQKAGPVCWGCVDGMIVVGCPKHDSIDERANADR